MGNVEPSDDDLEFQWNRHDGGVPGILSRMVARHAARACPWPDLMAHPHTSTRAYFSPLQDISSGRFVAADVVDCWSKTALDRVELTTSRGRWSLRVEVCNPNACGHGPLARAPLLGALNSIVDGGARFCIVEDHVVFADERERRALADAGVRFEEIEPQPTAARLIDPDARPTTAGTRAPRERKLPARAIRTAYRPILASSVDEQPCKFGGVSWSDDPLPRCACCGGATALLFQSPLSMMPIDFERVGILQVAICRGADPGACFIDGKGVAVRIVASIRSLPPSDPVGAPTLPLRAVLDWKPFEDLPCELDWTSAKIDDDLGEEHDVEADDGLKCGGWAAWIQHSAAKCPRCRRRCQLGLQVPEHDDIYFGDAGLLYVLVCDHARCGWVGAQIQYH